MKAKSAFFYKLALVLFSTLLTLFVVSGVYEIIAHIRYNRWHDQFEKQGLMTKVTIPSPNKKLMWEYRPYGHFMNIRINRWGFRDFDYPSQEKPDDLYRVAFAGDSVTMAMLVDADKGFVRRFEIGVNAQHRTKQFQAMTFAVDGYNAPQIEEMIRTKTVPFKPDKIVYVMCLNDFDFRDSSGFKILYFNPPKSFLLDRIEKAVQQINKEDFHLYHFRKNKKKVFESVIHMRQIARSSGAKFEIVVIPVFPTFPQTYNDYPLFGMHDEIGTFLKNNDIKYLDLLRVFQHSRRPSTYWAIDLWHPTVAGHQRIADKLIPAIALD